MKPNNLQLVISISVVGLIKGIKETRVILLKEGYMIYTLCRHFSFVRSYSLKFCFIILHEKIASYVNGSYISSI